MEQLTSKKLTAKQYLVVASLLFGLFFGAGNLIFPLHLGQLAGSHWVGARQSLGRCGSRLFSNRGRLAAAVGPGRCGNAG